MPEPQGQFDGQNPVPGYTLFQGKDGQNFYLKGEGLGDDEIRTRVAKLRGQAGAAAPAASQAQTPEEKAALQRSNATETTFEKENKPSVAGEGLRTAAKIPLKTVGVDTNAGGRPASWASGLGAGWDWLKGTLSSLNPFSENAMDKQVVHGMDDLSREARANWKTGRSVEPAQPNQPGAFQTREHGPVQRFGAELAHPALAAATREAASFVPVIGPGAVHAGHEIARASTPQEMGEGIADAGGTLGQAFLMTKPGQEFANQAIEKVGGPVNRAVVQPATELAANAMGRLRTPEAQQAMTQAIQPGVNIPRAQQSIQLAGPRMQQVREAMGAEIKNTGDGLEVNRAAKKEVLQAIEDRLGPVAELQPDTSGVAKAMRGSVDKITAKQYPAAVEAIERRAAVYDEGGHSLRDIENRIETLNNHLRNIYKQPTFGESPISMDAEASLAEVKALRDLLDRKVGELGGNGAGDLANLKREYGALRDVEKALARQHAIATRVKGAGLWEGLAYLHAAGDLMSGNLLGAMKSAGTLAVGKRLAQLRDPNYLLNQAFHGKNAFQAAEPIAPSAGPPAPKGLLPAPAKELPREASDVPYVRGYEPPADTSGPVRGGRWTTPAALLEERNVTPAREIPKPLQGGAGGYRMPPAGLLPETTRPATNIPPMVDEQFARERTRPSAAGNELAPERRLGPMGEGGVRTTPKGAISATPESLVPENARLLIRQTLDMLRSGDRPGRYFDESEAGDVRLRSRGSQFKGGDWRGVKSMRGMLPWLQHAPFTPAQLEAALKAFDKGKVTRAMQSAMEYVRNEAQHAGRMREPGED